MPTATNHIRWRILITVVLISAFSSFASDVCMKFAMPMANWIYNSNKGETHSEAGAWGLSLGYENYLNKSTYLSVNFETATTISWLSPPFITYYESVAYQSGVSVQYCKKMGRLSLGAGPMIGNMFYKSGMDTIYHSAIGLNEYACAGFHFVSEVEIYKNFSASLNYRPNIYNITEETLEYSHGLYLSLMFKTLRI